MVSPFMVVPVYIPINSMFKYIFLYILTMFSLFLDVSHSNWNEAEPHYGFYLHLPDD